MKFAKAVIKIQKADGSHEYEAIDDIKAGEWVFVAGSIEISGELTNVKVDHVEMMKLRARGA